jgi:ATP-dependent RNA helicase DHX29
LSRARSSNRLRQFFVIPEEYDLNSTNDLVVNSVVAWSFYPKLLTREGKGWRNVANNQSVALHPTSVNKHADSAVKWLSYYHIMQARNRNLNAHETSVVEDFAIALLCGDAEFKVRTLIFLFKVMMLMEYLFPLCRCTPASSPSTPTECDSPSETGSPCLR